MQRCSRWRAITAWATSPCASGATRGFRLRARLAIRGRLGAPKIGMFEPGTHRVVHIPDCTIQHPLINHVATVVRRSLVDAGVTCYSEAAHAGVARYLQVVVERSSQTAQVVLVANAATAEPLTECLESDPHPARRATAQSLVQLPLRTVERDPRAGIRELLRARRASSNGSAALQCTIRRARSARTTWTLQNASSSTSAGTCRRARASRSSMRASARSACRCCRTSQESA